MNDSKKSARPMNAFERANQAMLGYQSSWWERVISSIEENGFKANISLPEIIHFDDDLIFGPIILERRSITAKLDGKRKKSTWTITRPILYRFSALPLDELKKIAETIVEQCQSDWRQANIDNLIKEARSHNRFEALAEARYILGAGSTKAEIERIADQLRPAQELIEGGEAAAIFFDSRVSRCDFEEMEDGSLDFQTAALPPGKQPFGTSEWDYYSPDEVAELDGPESDWAYAFRILRLCEAIKSEGSDALNIAMQLGAVTREWEIWRENEEFIRKGKEHFAKQSNLARSKATKPWRNRVRQDFENGKIQSPTSNYARKIAKERSLNPPTESTIKNFISSLRRENAHLETHQ